MQNTKQFCPDLETLLLSWPLHPGLSVAQKRTPIQIIHKSIPLRRGTPPCTSSQHDETTLPPSSDSGDYAFCSTAMQEQAIAEYVTGPLGIAGMTPGGGGTGSKDLANLLQPSDYSGPLLRQHLSKSNWQSLLGTGQRPDLHFRVGFLFCFVL